MGNAALQKAIDSFDQIELKYVKALEDKGLKFAPRGSHEAHTKELLDELKSRGALFRNAGASIVTGWLSKACIECSGTGGSETFTTTLKCHRDCYFCFNHNLAEYDKFVMEGCPWEKELSDAYKATGGKLAAMGISGGEPLLVLDDSITLLERAREMFPGVHTRMYTSGDLLTVDSAKRLNDAGLREIRFSIKQDDPADRRERVLANMKIATEYIEDVVVEMPIIPGTKEVMQGWMRRFDEIGIKGMNLLEFCFPFHNWEEFEARGYKLKNPPYPVMYDYSYSGGLAVAGSEELCLELMLWALDEGLNFGMHYCSLENKHRSEMCQVNYGGDKVHPIFDYDEGDFYIKTAKVFGPDREVAKALLGVAGCVDMVEDEEEESLAFPRRYLPVLKDANVEPMIAICLMEKDEEGHYLQEVALKRA